MKFIGIISLLLFLQSCGNDDRFQRYDDFVPKDKTKLSFPIKSIEKTNSQVDILWVIDNSGSMSSIQNNVIVNTDIFMREFDKKGGIDWKMALISTDEDEHPYIGMDTIDGFNSRSQRRTNRFAAAVRALGTNGSYTEKTFTPIMKQLYLSNIFTREDAMLVIINVTDAEEQSRNVSGKDFLNHLIQLKGDISKIKFYGVYSSDDLGCDGESTWEFKTSKYKYVVQNTGGSIFPACSPVFGTKLTSLAKEIISYLQNSKIILDKRPKPDSIKVTYKGKELPGGSKTRGGMWYYDYNDNAIVFYSLDFAPGNEEIVEINFQEDEGF